MACATCQHTCAQQTNRQCGALQTHSRKLQLKKTDANSRSSTKQTHNSCFLAATTIGIRLTLEQASVLQLAIAARTTKMQTNAKQAFPWTNESTTKKKSFVQGIACSMGYASLVDAMHWDLFCPDALIRGSLELVQHLLYGSEAIHIQHRTTEFRYSVLRTTHAAKLIA